MKAFSIARRELRSLFTRPLAWVILAVVQFVLGYLFLSQLDEYLAVQPRLLGLQIEQGVTDIMIAPLLAVAGFILMLVVPMLTMRSFSEERRSRTLGLLLSAPLSMTEIVLGKFLGLLGFMAAMLALIALMPLSLLLGGTLDPGQLLAGLLGLGLLITAFTAVGLFLSSLTAEPVVAAISTFGALLLLWIIDWAGKTGEDGAGGVLAQLSMLRHYEALLRGVFNSQDLIYYLLVTFLFLALTVWRLDMERL